MGPGQGRDDDGTPDAPRHPVPLRLGRRFHGLRRLSLLVLGADGPEPLSHVDGLDRQRRQGGRPRPRQRRGGIRRGTYPERLQKAGISWKVYQDAGAGLDAAHSWGWGNNAHVGNYGDNSLLYFRSFQSAPRGSPLHDGHERLAGCHALRRVQAGPRRRPASASLVDCRARGVQRTPQLARELRSLVPVAVSGRPDLVSRGLESKTVLFLVYDESDGVFDHVVPTSHRRTTRPRRSRARPRTWRRTTTCRSTGPLAFSVSSKEEPARRGDPRRTDRNGDAGITLIVENRSAVQHPVRVADAYTKATTEHELGPGETMAWRWTLEGSFGWYDFTLLAPSDPTFERQLAGHVETRRNSASDPAICSTDCLRTSPPTLSGGHNDGSPPPW